jgi:ectoine hydroxylase-related dioxygenase (phytanoyl-CoA dioxygenase family)
MMFMPIQRCPVEGGALSFPEYGPRNYKVPAGSAVVFSGALLHAVAPVRTGRRYAFLPFLYGEAAAAWREKTTLTWHPVSRPTRPESGLWDHRGAGSSMMAG